MLECRRRGTTLDRGQLRKEARLCTYERRVRNLMLLVEEAYTLGMLLDEAEVPGDVVATDIDSTALPHKTLAFARPLRCIS